MENIYLLPLITRGFGGCNPNFAGERKYKRQTEREKIRKTDRERERERENTKDRQKHQRERERMNTTNI